MQIKPIKTPVGVTEASGMALSITKDQAREVARWTKTNFGDEIADDLKNSLTTDVLRGIACRETAYFWLSFLASLSRDDLLARCTLGASGDFPVTSLLRKKEAYVRIHSPERSVPILREWAALDRRGRGH